MVPALIGLLVIVLVGILQSRDEARAYARGYAACRDSCARAGSSLNLTPGARVATIMDRMGMRYTFMVDSGEQVHINSAGVDCRGEARR